MATGDTLLRPAAGPGWGPRVVFATVFVGFYAGFAVGYWVGRADGAAGERRRAVEAGAGRYAADPATGTVGFVFGPAPE